MEQDLLHQGLVPAETSLWLLLRVEFYCGLKPFTQGAGSGASWKGLWYRSMSSTACDQPGATCYEL